MLSFRLYCSESIHPFRIPPRLRPGSPEITSLLPEGPSDRKEVGCLSRTNPWLGGAINRDRFPVEPRQKQRSPNHKRRQEPTDPLKRLETIPAVDDRASLAILIEAVIPPDLQVAREVRLSEPPVISTLDASSMLERVIAAYRWRIEFGSDDGTPMSFATRSGHMMESGRSID